MRKSSVYQEVVDFIASGTNPEKVIAFRPSDKMQQRVSLLLQKNQEDQLSYDEKSELDHFMVIEHLMRLAKARAYQMLNKS